MKICVINQKGGSGKTTLAALVIEYLKARGGDVLAIDGDPQGGLTSLFLGDERPKKGTFDFLTAGGFQDVQARGVRLMAADVRLDKIVYTLPPYELENFQTGGDVVIDTPPTVQGITRAAIFASDLILVPADISRTSLAATLFTLDEVRRCKKHARVLLVGKQPKDGATGYMAMLFAEFVEKIGARNIEGVLPRNVAAQKAAAGMAKLPAAISEVLGGVL
jgi:chromosome partitioning protein